MPASPRRRARAVLLLGALLAATGARAQSRVTLSGHVSPRLRHSTLIGRAPADEQVDLSLVVRVDPDLMSRTLAGLYGPNAPKKKKFLTSAQFAQTFDLATKRQALKDFARANGLSVEETHDRPSSLIVHASGPAALVEKVFGIHLNHYRAPDGQVFRANEDNPSIPATLVPDLNAVIGFVNYHGAMKPHVSLRNPVVQEKPEVYGTTSPHQLSGNGPGGGLAPSDIKTIYGLSDASLSGSGQIVALVEFDGYRTSDVPLYEDTLFLSPHPNTSVTCVSRDSPTSCGLCYGSHSQIQNRNCSQISPSTDEGMYEVALDIDMSIALSSGATIDVYTAYNTSADNLNVYDWIASDDLATVVSTSWGLDEEDETTATMLSEQTIFEQMATQGQTVFAAAGDEGAYDATGITGDSDQEQQTLLTDDPASQPLVTGVGGTSLWGTVGASSETVWNNGCTGGNPGEDCSNGAGGGGVANFSDDTSTTTCWDLPAYQTGVTTESSTSYRNVPDVTLNADPYSGYATCVAGACNGDTIIGGTSAATPLWAALTSLVNQQRSQLGEGAIGFANPSFYGLAQTSYYSDVFNDITSGNNGYYNAGTGYDNASGWGSFKGNALIYALSDSSGVTVAAASNEFAPIGYSSVTVNWLAPTAMPGIQYTAQASSDSFLTVAATSVTYNTASAFTSLLPGTTYSFQVQAVYATIPGPVSALGQKETLPAPPQSSAATAVSTNTIALSWSSGGNPAGTPYEVSWSADGFVASFSTPIAFAADFTGTTTDVAGLSPSTTYSFRVRAENSEGIASAFSATVTTATFGPPSAITLTGSALGTSSATWNWTAPLANGVTDYFVYSSSNGVILATTTAQTFTLTGLSTNTANGLQVQPANAYGLGPLTSAATIYTLAAVPDAPGLTAAASYYLSLSWSSNGNPDGTPYELSQSTDGFIANFSTPIAFGADFTGGATTLTGLAADTTYSFRLRARNVADVVTGFSATAPEETLLGPVSGLSASAQGTSSITWNWNLDGDATAYFVLASSDAVQLGAVAAPPFTLTGLSTNTAYGVEVVPSNGSGVGPASAAVSAYTLAAPPTSFAFSAVGYSSITVQWAADDNLPGVAYEAQLWAATGATTTLTLTGLTTTFMGLSPFTTYYAQVGALNNAGVLAAGGVQLSTVTPPGPPTSAPGILAATALGISSISWTWQPVPTATGYYFYPSTGGAPLQVAATGFIQAGLNLDTAYGASVSAVNGSGQGPLTSTVTTYTLAAPPTSFALVSVGYSSITLQWAANNNPGGVQYQAQLWAATGATTTLTLTDLTTTFAGLAPLTTYYTQVAALNSLGIASPGGVVLATATPVNPPSATPGGLSASALGVSSISWSWNAVSSATAYDFYPSTGGTPIQVAAPGFVQTGLNIDASYGASVSAVNASGESPLSSTVTTYTLAAAPTGFGFVSVGVSSVTVQWGADDNPGGVLYAAQLWAATGATTTLTLTGLTTTFAGLSPLATYYTQVGALNGSEILTPGGVVLATTTLPSPLVAAPGGLAGAGLGISSAGWTWNSLPGATAYDVYIATTGGTSLQAVSTATAYAFTALAPDQPAAAFVAGINASGAGPLSAGVTVYSLAAPPVGGAVSPVFITSAAVDWQTGGNFAGTRYSLDYGLLSGATTTLVLSSTQTILTGLQAESTYFLYIEALNGADVASAAAGELDFETLPPLAGAGAATSTGTVISFDAPKGPIVVTIPPGAFAAPVNVTVTAPDSFPAAPSAAALTGTGVGLLISLSQPVQPQVPSTISLSYANTPFTAYDPDTLLIARYDSTDDVWVPLPSTPYPAQELVTAVTSHFSLFQIMASVAPGNLSSPKVFPNPMRPALGENTVTFADLPSGTTLKIYDILGERVRELSADASGIAVWDGRNSGGQNVASGVYFVLAASGSSRAILKVGIQR